MVKRLPFTQNNDPGAGFRGREWWPPWLIMCTVNSARRPDPPRRVDGAHRRAGPHPHFSNGEQEKSYVLVDFHNNVWLFV
eukprot:357713-Chlamydomonas_euryale.AAC.26